MKNAYISETSPNLTLQLVSNHWSKLSVSRYFKFYLLQLFKNNFIEDTIENDQEEEEEEEEKEEEEEEEEEDLGSDLEGFIVEDSQSQDLVSGVNFIENDKNTTGNFSLADEVSFRP